MIPIAGIIVVLTALWLIGLAGAMLFTPAHATRFLELFASSARAHYTEQILRLLAGAAMVVFAPEMRFAGPFRLFGWILLVTAIGLMLVPWRWHHRFGRWVIPLAIRHIRMYGVAALGLGALILYAAL